MRTPPTYVMVAGKLTLRLGKRSKKSHTVSTVPVDDVDDQHNVDTRQAGEASTLAAPGWGNTSTTPICII